MEIKKAMSCLLAAALLSACQPTPEEDIIVNKGDGALEAAIAATAVPAQPYQVHRSGRRRWK